MVNLGLIQDSLDPDLMGSPDPDPGGQKLTTKITKKLINFVLKNMLGVSF
jgi:hypothetical protein